MSALCLSHKRRNVSGPGRIIGFTFACLIAAQPAAAQLEKLRDFAFGSGQQDSKQIAYFKLKGPMPEAPTPFPPLFGGEPPITLHELLDRLKQARQDTSVVAVVVDLQEAALGFAQVQEIHAALRKVASVDKGVFVHADALRTSTYAAATGAAHISLVPTGELWLVGLYGETPYLRGLLDKIGCVPDFEQMGDYKTAAEIITRTEPSRQSREMTRWLIDGVYDDLLKLIAEGRGITDEKVRSLIDEGPFLADAALAAGLIDSVQHRQEFVADLKRRYGSGVKVVTDYGKRDKFDVPKDPFAMIPWLMQLLNPAPKVYSRPSVAIVYVEGPIMTGSAEFSPLTPAQGAYSTTIRKALDKAAQDRSVKAVVLRVDSPGGSALASEIILDASKRVAKRKPLVVSMGNVAGSGGYYVSCGADAIFADGGTITASIGVLGGKLVTTGTWDKLGINWHEVQRGEMAGMLSSAAPFSDDERARLRHYLSSIYDVFKSHVVAARGSKLTKPIDEIAGGRVFTGRQALGLGLVDRLGGLDDALKYAADQAGVAEFDVRILPEPPSIFDLLTGRRDKDETIEVAAAPPLALHRLPPLEATLSTLSRVDPLRARLIQRAITAIELVHREQAALIMLNEILIR